MAYKHLFVDSDVLLDMLLTREPFSDYTQLLLLDSADRDIKLSTSALVIANINYILSKKVGALSAKTSIRKLIKLVNVLSFEDNVVEVALASSIGDFEDAIQSIIAERYHCEAIITRNTKHYKQSNLPVYTAEQYLNTL
jgi:predicted nucleic acid-binding protein